MKDLVIFGTGGLAREFHELVEDINAEAREWNFLGFLDGDAQRHGGEIHGCEILGGVEWLKGRGPVAVVIGIGSPATKYKVTREIVSARHITFATLFHPSARVGRRVHVGAGTVISAGSILTTDIIVGRHVTINLACTVGHDALLEDFVTVAPSVNVSGAVSVGEGADLGTGSRIIQGVSVGPWSVVGAGAVVVRDVTANTTAVGIPAKSIKERPAGWHLPRQEEDLIIKANSADKEERSCTVLAA